MINKIVKHFLIWVLVIALLIIFTNQNENLWDRTKNILIIFPVLLIQYYFHLFLYNRFFEKNVTKYYYGIISIIVFSSIYFTIQYQNIKYFESISLAIVFFIVIVSFSFASNSFFYRIAYEKSKRIQAQTELQVLQFQVNPHFMFNTLNNIYAQNLSDSLLANEMILQYADLVRYQLESSGKEKVLIKEEIDFIEKYIALEKIRVHKTISIHFEKSIQNENIELPPMIFLPFIENAFKYGNTTMANTHILFSMEQYGNKIVFTAENYISKHQVINSTKAGLLNVQKRLELLFPNRYLLQIKKNELFTINLQIEL
jgi:sensor histidine kinase YesM